MEIKLYKLFKYIFINTIYFLYIPQLFFFIFVRFFSKDHIRVINYHDIDFYTLENFEKQIKFILKFYDNCDLKKFTLFFSSKKNNFNKPLIIFSFDDGLLSHYKFVLPILNKYKLTGWFFIPTNFINTNASKINLINNYNGDVSSIINQKIITSKVRHFMNWDEIRNIISQNHIIGSHSHNHVRLVDELPQSYIDDQIILSKNIIEAKTNQKINFFCWVGGEEYSYGKKTYDTIKLNYKYAFSTNYKTIKKYTDKLLIDRTNIETSYLWSFFIFYFSGLIDFLYIFKRLRLRKKMTSKLK